ncbi:cation:proton antiporter [Cucumibacter marinus]|uniref:cation:proton antiporter n=1 Tax=Cucumibacter marinus TaxID=1121252 RepID=UPI00040CFC46|nr:cation:proton antiporter [Cucumibacter marinus]
MSPEQFLDFAIAVALGLLSLAMLLVTWRIMRGPSLPDRILALDMLVNIGIGYIVIVAIKTGFMLYLDIAISLGLIGFLATIAFARFVLQRWRIRTTNHSQPNNPEGEG